MNTIEVLEERCTGCGACVKVCPVPCIALEPSEKARTHTQGKPPWKSLAVIDVSRCIYCGACVEACRTLWEKAKTKENFNAIEMTVEQQAKSDLSAYRGVFCCADFRRGRISPTIYELLHIGRILANDLQEPLCGVLIGRGTRPFAQDLIEHGADTVFVCDDLLFEDFVDETFAKALAALVAQAKPNKLILPASAMGRSLSARLAILTETGLTADATELRIDQQTGLLHVTRPTFGGNLMATIICQNRRPEICTLRPLTYPKAVRTPGHSGTVADFKVDLQACRAKTRFVGFVPEESGEVDVATAEVVVSGGRGLGRAEGFKLLGELAHALAGSVGSSRAAVDSGWIPYRHQVGLTGKTIKPKLYIACGISGQVQHLAGMSSSDVIVAINKDPDCPLMQYATFSVQGDLFEIVPALLGELKKRRD